jgi:hypothetical protein
MFGSFMPQFSGSKSRAISGGGEDSPAFAPQYGNNTPNTAMPGMGQGNMARQAPSMGMGGFNAQNGMRAMMPSPQNFMQMMGQQQGPMPQASVMGQQHANPGSATGRMAEGLFRGFNPFSSGSTNFGAAEQRGMPMQPPGMRPGDLGGGQGPIADMYRGGQIQTMNGPMQGGFRFA